MLSIIGVAFPGTARVRAITVYGMVMGVAAAGGQLLGGLIIAANPLGLGWRAVFLVNVPIGLAALTMARRSVPESRTELPPGLDVRDMALVGAALTALILPLVDGPHLGWPAWTWASLAVSPVLFGLFAASQLRSARRGGSPLLDPALFRRRALAAGQEIPPELAAWTMVVSEVLNLDETLNK